MLRYRRWLQLATERQRRCWPPMVLSTFMLADGARSLGMPLPVEDFLRIAQSDLRSCRGPMESFMELLKWPWPLFQTVDWLQTPAEVRVQISPSRLQQSLWWFKQQWWWLQNLPESTGKLVVPRGRRPQTFGFVGDNIPMAFRVDYATEEKKEPVLGWFGEHKQLETDTRQLKEDHPMEVPAMDDEDETPEVVAARIRRERLAAALGKPNTDQLRRSFAAFDLNSDGELDLSEVKKLLRAGKPSMKDNEIETIFKKVDKNHNNRISFSELVSWVFSGNPNDSEKNAFDTLVEFVPNRRIQVVDVGSMLGDCCLWTLKRREQWAALGWSQHGSCRAYESNELWVRLAGTTAELNGFREEMQVNHLTVLPEGSTSLDTLLKDVLGDDLWVLKIHTDGSELDLLRGAFQILSSGKVHLAVLRMDWQLQLDDGRYRPPPSRWRSFLKSTGLWKLFSLRFCREQAVLILKSSRASYALLRRNLNFTAG
eukprot:symbB.v1.2.000170.t1/scaffold9.1/size550961/26